MPLSALLKNPNALVAFVYFYLVPGMPPSQLGKVRAIYRRARASLDPEEVLARGVGKLREKYEPLLPLPKPPKGGPMPCPVCGAALDADPEHWRLAGRARCPVRAYLTKEEAVLELASLGATPESVEAAKLMDAPFVVNAGVAVLKGTPLEW